GLHCDARRVSGRPALARRAPALPRNQSRLSRAARAEPAPRRRDGRARGDLSRLARLPEGSDTEQRPLHLLPRLRARRLQRWRYLRAGRRGFRAPQLRLPTSAPHPGAGAHGRGPRTSVVQILHESPHVTGRAFGGGGAFWRSGIPSSCAQLAGLQFRRVGDASWRLPRLHHTLRSADSVVHPESALDFDHVEWPLEGCGSGRAGLWGAADGLEEVLEPWRGDDPEHHEIIGALVDDLVFDVVAEEARGAGHEPMLRAVDHDPPAA